MTVTSGKRTIRTTEGPSSAEWEGARTAITRLYREEDRRLDEVRKVMQEQHGFVASSNMYKRRLSKWNLDKKRKRNEMIVANQIISERKLQGKATHITIRGRILTEDDIRNYFKRIPGAENWSSSVIYPRDSSLDLQCSTPSPEPIDCCLGISEPSNSNPDHETKTKTTNEHTKISKSKSYESTCDDASITRNNRDVQLDPHQNRFSAETMRCESVISPDSALLPLDCAHRTSKALHRYLTMYDDLGDYLPRTTPVLDTSLRNIARAARLYGSGVSKEANLLLSTGFDGVRDDLKKHRFTLPLDLMIATRIMISYRLHDLLIQFVTYVYKMSNIVLGPLHPFTILSSSFRSVSQLHDDGLGVCCNFLLDYSLSRLGVTHRYTEDAIINFHQVLGNSSDMIDALSNEMNGMSLEDEPTTFSYLHAGFTIVNLHIEEGNLITAHNLLDLSQTGIDQLRSKKLKARLNIISLSCRSEAYSLSGNLEKKVVMLKQAWLLAKAWLDLNDPAMITLMCRIGKLPPQTMTNFR